MNYTKSYYITNIFVIDRFLSTEIPNFEKVSTFSGYCVARLKTFWLNYLADFVNLKLYY